MIQPIVEELSKEIAGERELLTNLLYMVGGNLVLNKNPLSYHTVLNSESGAGKDFILSRVMKIFNENIDYERYTRITPRALDYLHANETEFSWDGMFLVLHDVDENILNSSTMKLFLTEGSKTAIVDKGFVWMKHVKGRPIVFMTTAYSDPSIEQLRRVNILNLDESEEQTKRILKTQSEFSLNEDQPDRKINYSKIKEFMSNLKPVKVKIPFTDKIIERVACSDIHIRTFFPKILDLIKSSTAWNQRERDRENGFVLANEFDYENIRYLVNSFAHGTTFRPLSLARKEALTNLRDNFGEGELFSVSDFSNVEGITYEGARKQLRGLVKENYVEIVREKDEQYNKTYTRYRLLPAKKIQLPTILEG